MKDSGWRGKRWSGRSSAEVENDLMIGYYSIQKLVKAHKVSDEILDRSLRFQGYPWTGSPVNVMNWDSIDQKYDLGPDVALARR
jgi:hypothetical protein